MEQRLTGKAMAGVSESETILYIGLIMIPTARALEKAGVYRLLDLWVWGFMPETCRHYLTYCQTLSRGLENLQLV